MNIEKLLKGGQLTEIDVEEVSLVGSPANSRRFLFTKAADFEFNIKTDQTFDGTTVAVNGEELKNLDSFNIWLNNVSDEDMEEWGAEPFSASWTLRESSEDGVDQVSRFTVSTEVKKMDKKETIKALKSEYSIDVSEADFDALSEDRQKSLEGFATFAKAFPEPFTKSSATAITALLKKDEAPAEPAVVVDTGTPVATPPDGTADPAPQTDQGTATPDSEATIKALEARIAALEKPTEETPAEGEEAEPTAVEKQLKALEANMAAIAESVGAKLSSETDIEKGDGAKDDWPSWKI